jgi:hypothetical protein
MPGLVPGIQATCDANPVNVAWMPVTSTGMTDQGITPFISAMTSAASLKAWLATGTPQ